MGIRDSLYGDDIDQVDCFDFLYSQMKNLRKKLTERGCPDYIQTIYGVGYKPVSYTHLEVYKRQLRPAAAAAVDRSPPASRTRQTATAVFPIAKTASAKYHSEVRAADSARYVGSVRPLPDPPHHPAGRE